MDIDQLKIELERKTYRELQILAREVKIKANMKRVEIINQLLLHHSKNNNNHANSKERECSPNKKCYQFNEDEEKKKLEILKYNELRSHAKRLGIKAVGKKVELIEKVINHLKLQQGKQPHVERRLSDQNMNFVDTNDIKSNNDDASADLQVRIDQKDVVENDITRIGIKDEDNKENEEVLPSTSSKNSSLNQINPKSITEDITEKEETSHNTSTTSSAEIKDELGFLESNMNNDNDETDNMKNDDTLDESIEINQSTEAQDIILENDKTTNEEIDDNIEKKEISSNTLKDLSNINQKLSTSEDIFEKKTTPVKPVIIDNDKNVDSCVEFSPAIDNRTYVIDKTPQFHQIPRGEPMNRASEMTFLNFEELEETVPYATSTPMFPKSQNQTYTIKKHDSFQVSSSENPPILLETPQSTSKPYINPWRTYASNTPKMKKKSLSPLYNLNDSMFSTPRVVSKRKVTIPVLTPRMKELAEPRDPSRSCEKTRSNSIGYKPHTGPFKYVDTLNMKHEKCVKRPTCRCCRKE